MEIERELELLERCIARAKKRVSEYTEWVDVFTSLRDVREHEAEYLARVEDLGRSQASLSALVRRRGELHFRQSVAKQKGGQ